MAKMCISTQSCRTSILFWWNSLWQIVLLFCVIFTIHCIKNTNFRTFTSPCEVDRMVFIWFCSTPYTSNARACKKFTPEALTQSSKLIWGSKCHETDFDIGYLVQVIPHNVVFTTRPHRYGSIKNWRAAASLGDWFHWNSVLSVPDEI